MLFNLNSPAAEERIRDIEEAARTFGRQLPILKAATERDFDAAFATLARTAGRALFVGGDAFFTGRAIARRVGGSPCASGALSVGASSSRPAV